jgi:branched-chain amino acid transport system ATP-binding protein
VSTALDVRGLNAGYGPVEVLHDVSLRVACGERIGLVGLNGHGKSTLLRSIVGLAGWRKGVVEVLGRDVSGMRPHKLVRAGVGLAPQADSLFPGMSVRENLDSAAVGRRLWKSRAKRRERVLEIFPSLANHLDQAAGTLSGGERRMVSVGRCLMADSRLYLIDEPSLGLAPGLAARLLDVLATLDVSDGALVVAEQNVVLLEGRVDRILRLHGGRIEEHDPAIEPITPPDQGGRAWTSP